MSVTRVKKTVVAVVLLLMFTMGGFALSLAHENVRPIFGFSLESGLEQSDGAWRQDGYPFQFGLGCEIGRLSSLMQSLTHGTRRVETLPAARAHSSAYSRVYAPKISLHLLDSILLI